MWCFLVNARILEERKSDILVFLVRFHLGSFVYPNQKWFFATIGKYRLVRRLLHAHRSWTQRSDLREGICDVLITAKWLARYTVRTDILKAVTKCACTFANRHLHRWKYKIIFKEWVSIFQKTQRKLCLLNTQVHYSLALVARTATVFVQNSWTKCHGWLRYEFGAHACT